MKLGCIVMAAGNASRFGSNKLLAELNGKSLVRRVMEALPKECFSRIVVVSQYPEVLALAREFGFSEIFNSAPKLGQSHSIHLGLQALSDCDGVLFQVGDQPNLTRKSICALVALFCAHPDHIVALGHNGQRGNPCLFPAAFFPEIMEIQGDRGGNVVIEKHRDRLLLLETAAAELQDVDTPEILAALQ